MAIYLGLGSNLGDRRENLRAALAMLAQNEVTIDRVSPVVESPALLPPDAPADWNAPYLNLVAECRSPLAPADLLSRLKKIERGLGRAEGRRWAPRPIDIDILIYDDARIDAAGLTIPHAGIGERAFVLTPLSALNPGLEIPGLDRTVQDLKAEHGRRIPLWMGIVNLTPDSFSDGGQNGEWRDVAERIDSMVASGVQIVDFGAESTRPGAVPLTPAEEWARLEPILERVLAEYAGDMLRPRISVDTYHSEIAGKALSLGVDVINDVGGLMQPDMLELAAGCNAEFIAMHNLGLPADPKKVLACDRSAADQLEEWLDTQLETWQSAGLDLGRIIFDPGIGFGKNALQSLDLLREIGRFNRKDVRLLVGHSRKSFMTGFGATSPHERDLATIGSSLALCERGVDILRVHNVADHAVAYRGWAHMQSMD